MILPIPLGHLCIGSQLSMGISTGWLVFFNPWASLTPGAAETACGGRWWRRKADGLLLQEVSSSPLSEAPSSRERWWWWWWWWSLDHLIIWWSCSWNTWCSSTKGSTITSIYSTKRGHRRFVLGVLVVLSGANCWYRLKNCQRSPWHWRFQGGEVIHRVIEVFMVIFLCKIWGPKNLSSNMRNIF